jgi:hypothetical protein
VDAPEGTAALPKQPFCNVTSTSTVGFPRESKISLAFIDFISDEDMICYLCEFEILNMDSKVSQM